MFGGFTMERYYYLSDNLDDLKKVENELQGHGIESLQLHVLSQDSGKIQADLEYHNLHSVNSIMKKDLMHSGLIGLVIGLFFALATLFLAYQQGWTETATGWMPFIFLAILIMGFCTWEGGLFGLQEPNQELDRFSELIDKDHVLFYVDVDTSQASSLRAVVLNHPKLQYCGEGQAPPAWIVGSLRYAKKMIKALP